MHDVGTNRNTDCHRHIRFITFYEDGIIAIGRILFDQRFSERLT